MSDAPVPQSARITRGAALAIAALGPHLLVPAWIGAAAAAARLPNAEVGGTTSWLAVGGWSLILAGTHLWNLAADRQSDAYNRKNLFWHGRIAPRRLSVTGWITAGCGLLLVGVSVPAATAPALVTLLVGAAYSLPPCQLATRWGWDLTCNAFGYGLVAPWLGLAVVGTAIGVAGVDAHPDDTLRGVTSVLMRTAAVLLPLVAGAFLWSTLLDVAGDRAVGKRSWAVRWGQRATAVVVLVVLAVSGAARLVWPSPAHRWDAVAVGGCLVVGVAVLWRPRSRWLIRGGVFLAVATAALPAAVRWPRLALFWLVWTVASYAITARAGYDGNGPTER